MPFLIDGHNLIPHVPGIGLDDLEDERALIQRLLHFAGRRGTRIEVFFDRALPGTARVQQYGRVKVRFASRGTSADHLIRKRLGSLGRGAKNWTVVSSDREVVREAQGSRARVITAQEFAVRLEGKGGQAVDQGSGSSSPEKADDVNLSREEVAYWMDQFSSE